jgi:hypothetical protein
MQALDGAHHLASVATYLNIHRREILRVMLVISWHGSRIHEDTE